MHFPLTSSKVTPWALAGALFSFSVLTAGVADAVDTDTAGDATITIRRGQRASDLDLPDFKVESGTDEISGEPVAGLKESYESWKSACNQWKKEMREMNGASLLSLSCGAPRVARDASSRTTQSSTGNYKIKVRIREAK